VIDPYQAALGRCSIDPGLPVANPTKSFWQKTPHQTLENIQSPVLPKTADIVVIGSGITGCSFVHHMLAVQPDINIVMLEARTITSGATGRNGGHIKDSPFNEYTHLKERLGRPAAEKIVRFRMSHLNTMIRVAEESGAEATQRSELRRVHGIHVFTKPHDWELSKAGLLAFLEDFPDQKGRWKAVEGEELEVSVLIYISFHNQDVSSYCKFLAYF
jgi:glycine/D-amino acid oxidase-like deaminating enzyme